MGSRRRRGTARIMLGGYVRLGDSTGREERRASGSTLTVSYNSFGLSRTDHVEHIPSTLGQQTQTLLRTTMESKLTDKVSHEQTGRRVC
jgi:hypothetical protein